MAGAPPSPAHYGDAVPVRRRLTSFAIALLINILILIGLFQLAPAIQGKKDGHGLSTFNLANADDKAASAKKQSQQKQATKATATTRPALIKPTVEPPVLPPSKLPSNFIQLSHNDFAAADVGKIQSAPAAASGDNGQESGSGRGDSPRAGNGPHGEPLYAAEWYRRPTDAELDFYFKGRVPNGAYATIACKTIARFHVDDCVPLEDAPAGSGLSRKLVQAAWQLLVRPPRVGGKSMVGAWVSIRIDFYTKKVSVTGSGTKDDDDGPLPPSIAPQVHHTRYGLQ